MDENRIREILGNLSSRICGFEAYAVTNNPLCLKQLTLSEDGQDGGLKCALKNSIIQTINDKYLNSDSKYEFATNVSENKNVFYIIDQSDSYCPFKFLNQPYDSFSESDIPDVYGFIFVFRYDDQKVHCFQKGNNTTIPNRQKTKFLTRLLSTENNIILTPQKENVISFSKCVDAVIIDDSIITDNIRMMERCFDFCAFIYSNAENAAKRISESGLFSNNKIINDYISRDVVSIKRYCTKLMKVIDSPVLNMDKKELCERLSTVERWKGKFAEPIDDVIPLKSFKDVEQMIDLLNERFTVSQVTGQEYDTESKKKAT